MNYLISVTNYHIMECPICLYEYPVTSGYLCTLCTGRVCSSCYQVIQKQEEQYKCPSCRRPVHPIQMGVSPHIPPKRKDTTKSILPSQLSGEQQRAFELYRQKKSFMMTGPGGCGKSYMIRLIQQDAIRRNQKIAVTSTTGCSAYLVSGMTIHSWSGIGLGTDSADTLLRRIRKNMTRVREWRETNILVIDEVSMMSGELFEKIDTIGRSLRRCPHRLFGGIQLILTGDFAQLLPVSYDKLLFELPQWSTWFPRSSIIYMKENHRQTRDTQFQDLLRHIRLGTLKQNHIDLLSSRILSPTTIQHIYQNSRIKPTLLYPYRKDVQSINQRRMKRLIGKGKRTITCQAIDKKKSNTDISTIPSILSSPRSLLDPNSTLLSSNESNSSNNPSNESIPMIEKESEFMDRQSKIPRQVDFVERAQVMLTINLDIEQGLVNGTRGIIESFPSKNRVMIKFENGIKRTIEPYPFEIQTRNWKYIRYQLPLEYAWAMTIHKSQGSTLSSVITNLSGVFCDGQVYVTLSRVRSLDGLYLEDIDFDKITCDQRVKSFYQSLDVDETIDENDTS